LKHTNKAKKCPNGCKICADKLTHDRQTKPPHSLYSTRQHHPKKTQPCPYFESQTMNHTEAAYINAGFSYEKGKTPAETLRHMIESETIPHRTEARRLIDQGRQEARLSTTPNR
jgi:hypothetical protein